MATTRGIRQRVREELTREIKDVARRHLAEHGASGLSMRAVARELGMASSAVYRYFPSRDTLLTALIIDAYEGVGAAATSAEARVPRDDYTGRWLAVFRAVRDWAGEHPHEYALIYGSPIPGYVAPEDTAAPASVVVLLLAHIVADARADSGTVRRELSNDGQAGRLSETLVSDMEQLKSHVSTLAPESGEAMADAAPVTMVNIIDAWTMLFGAVSFETFGHYRNVLDARGDYLDRLALKAAAPLGLLTS